MYLAAVFLRDLAHDREAQAGAARLAGGVGFEPALAEALRQPRPVVGHGEFDPVLAALVQHARGDTDLRLARFADGFERVLDQVVQGLAQAYRIAAHERLACREVARQRDALVVLVKVQYLADERMKRERARRQLRRTRVVAECIDHRLERLDLADDGARGAVDQLRLLRREAAEEAPAQAFGRELDGSQRILHLVREATRDLAPRSVALRLVEHRQVVEHDHVAGVAGQRGAAHHQEAAAFAGFQHDFLAPLARVLAQVARQRPKQRREPGMVGGEIGEGAPGVAPERHREDRLRRAVGDPQAPFAVEAEHARGQPLQHRFEPGALLLGFACTLLRASAGQFQLARHLGERLHQEAELVIARHRQRRVEAPGSDRARGRGQATHWRHQPARDGEGRQHHQQHRQQQHEGQDQGEGELERAAQELEALEVEAGAFDAARQRLQLLRQREDALQQPVAAQRAAERRVLVLQRQRHAQGHVVAERLGRRVTPLAAQAHQQRAVGDGRIEIAWIGAGSGEHATVGAEHGELDRAERLDRLVERALGLACRRGRHARGEFRALRLGLGQVLVDDDAADRQRIVQRLFEADVEPGVDGGVEEAQRKPVHHHHRRHRQQDQHAQQAAVEACARHAPHDVAPQPPQAHADGGREQRQRHGRGSQHPAVMRRQPAALAGGIVGQLQRREQQRERRQQRQHAAQEQVQGAPASHRVPAEDNCHAGSNRAGRRSAPGRAPGSSATETSRGVPGGSCAKVGGSPMRSAPSAATRVARVAKLRTSSLPISRSW